MERREAVKSMALALGITISAPTLSALFSGCGTQTKENPVSFTADDETLIAEIAETILPETNTPGAKAAKVGPFIVMMLKECYKKEDQKKFVKGLKKVDKISQIKFNKIFVELSVAEKNTLIKQLAEDTIKYKKEENELHSNELKNTDPRGRDATDHEKETAEDRSETYFFPVIHELTLLGYFTSEIGATQALEYVPIPAKFNPCIEMKPEQRGWAL